MAAQIKKLKNNNNTIYPITVTKAIYDQVGRPLSANGIMDYVVGPNDTKLIFTKEMKDFTLKYCEALTSTSGYTSFIIPVISNQALIDNLKRFTDSNNFISGTGYIEMLLADYGGSGVKDTRVYYHDLALTNNNQYYQYKDSGLYDSPIQLDGTLFVDFANKSNWIKQYKH